MTRRSASSARVVEHASRDDRPILLLGKDGQLGWEMRPLLEPLGTVIATARKDLSLEMQAELREEVRRLQPGLIVNCAAYTAVDSAEADPESAMVVNGQAPGVLAEEAIRCGAALVHFSTDYVFDGTKRTPYTEQDPTRPLNAYGESKLAGEQAIKQVGGAYLILRSSWLYGMRRTGFLTRILERAREGNEVRVVHDQVGSPTWCRSLAESTARRLASVSQAMAVSWADAFRRSVGVYHWAAAGEASWYDFARRAIEHESGLRGWAASAPVAIASSEYPTKVRRPAYSVLSSTTFEKEFGVAPIPWRDDLARCLNSAALPSPDRPSPSMGRIQ